MPTTYYDVSRQTSNVALPADVSQEIWSNAVGESAFMQLARQIRIPGTGTTIQTITGEPTANYVLRVRMGKAKRLVRTTSASIGEVAAKCGFQDVAHFSRAFKQFFGVTPSQYRKNVD